MKMNILPMDRSAFFELIRRSIRAQAVSIGPQRKTEDSDNSLDTTISPAFVQSFWKVIFRSMVTGRYVSGAIQMFSTTQGNCTSR